jgi:hypothetical protein
MTTIEIMLPDELAQRAKSAGLLSDSAIQLLLEDAIRRRAGRALVDVARRIQAAGVEPMSMEEIDAEVKAYRAERRAGDNAKNTSPGGEPGDDAGRS